MQPDSMVPVMSRSLLTPLAPSRRLRKRRYRRILLWSLFVSFFWLLMSPQVSMAHLAYARVVRSDPDDLETLRVPPQQVRLWFDEPLDPSASFIAVVDDNNQGVDEGRTQVSSTNNHELTIGLEPRLPAGTYTIVWQSASRQDGSLNDGTLHFTVTRPDGSVPERITRPYLQPSPGLTQSHDTLLQGIFTALRFLGPPLQTIGLIFWLGGQCWLFLFLLPTLATQPEQNELRRAIQQRWEQQWAPWLVLLLLAVQGGALIPTAGTVLDTRGALAFQPATLVTVITSTRAGLFWFVQCLLLLFAFQLALARRLAWRRSQRQFAQKSSSWFLWGNIILGLALLSLPLMASQASGSGHLAEEATVLLTPLSTLTALGGSFLHALAAVLWIGSLLTLVLICLPVLKREALLHQAHVLLQILRWHTPWAWVGVGLMALTGPLLVSIHIPSWQEALTSLYGGVFGLKQLLVLGILLLSAYHVFRWCPQLRQSIRPLADQQREHEENDGQEHLSPSVPQQTARQTKQQEALARQLLERFYRILLAEALLGIGVLLCAGVLTVL